MGFVSESTLQYFLARLEPLRVLHHHRFPLPAGFLDPLIGFFRWIIVTLIGILLP